MEEETLPEMAEQQQGKSTGTLSTELSPSQSNINRHIHKLSLVNLLISAEILQIQNFS